MNKSKFLKRSLAALLAILMVVAMVPASAFAAEPDIIKVNGVEVTRSGDAYSVSITAPNGTASVIENALKSVTFELRSKNGITVGILDKDGKQKDVDLAGWPDEPGTKQTINLLDYAVKPEGTYWGDYTGMKLQITTSAGVSTIYPLTVNVSERNASSDTTITAVESTRIVSANVDLAKHHIEIIKPVGCDNTKTMLGLTESNFKLASPNAEVSFTEDNDIISLVTVTAEDKSTQKYTISYKVETIFTEFKVPNMISYKEAEITGTGVSANDDKGKVEITVEVPYDTFHSANGDNCEIVPTFTASENIKVIKSKDNFTHGDGVLYERYRGTTSGVAKWTGAVAADADKATDAGAKSLTFKFDVETGKSSLEAAGSDNNTGTVKVIFKPVKNTEAKITGVKVGAAEGANTFNQGLIEIANGTIARNIIVGDVKDEKLADTDANKADTNVVKQTLRDIKLMVSNNSTVTVLNPDEGLVISKYDDTTTEPAADANANTTVKDSSGDIITADVQVGVAYDGIVTLENVNLRKYHSTPMRVLVTSEDGKTKTEYRLTFKGTPSGKPEVKEVILHGKDGTSAEGAVVKSTQDKDGNIIIRVPYNKAIADKITAKTVATSDLTGLYDKITVKATDGATTAVWDRNLSAYHLLVNEKSNMPSSMSRPDNTSADEVGFGDFGFVLHSSFTNSAIGVNDNNTHPSDESTTKVGIYIEKAKTTANITDITLTEKNELVDAAGNKLPGKVNPNNKTIRIDVPYSFNRNDDNTTKAGTNLYLYDWAFNGTNVGNITDYDDQGTVAKVKYDFADLSTQEVDSGATNEDAHVALVTLTEKDITTVAEAPSFTPTARHADAGNVIYVWNEKDDAANSARTQYYTVYAVRADASSESKLNSVSASAPVTVTKDTSVEKLNRFIITIPKNYNSTTGINDAKEFELNFSDRSKNSTVENGQTVWAAKGVDTVKFKVADGKLYFKDNEANLTDGRVIHFTIRAEDRTSTGAYEFLIREGEPSTDTSLSGIKVDDNVSFEKDGSSFIVKDLTEDENYDVTKLPVVITTTDPGATVTVDGKDYIPEVTTVDLSEGKTATVVVTAADEVTTATYTLSMRQGEEPGTDPADSYTDLDKVPSGMRETVRKAINLGLMTNTGKEGIFDPKANVSRKDFAVIIARADMMASNPEIEDSKMADTALAELADDSVFNDLGGLKDIQKGAIAYCKEKGYINGNDKGGFDPNKGLSRQEATVILAQWRGLTVDKTATGNDNNVSDWSKADNWAKPYINAVLENKLMNGKDFGFDPKGSVNREQTAVMLVNVFDQKYPEFE